MRAETDTDATVYHTIAERIDAACRALNMKQRELAERAGLPTRQLLTQIKSGERPGRKHVESLAVVIGCTVEWLTTGTGQAPSWATDGGPRRALTLREAGEAYNASPDDLADAPPWARWLVAEVQSLRAEVAALRTIAPRTSAAGERPRTGPAAEIDRIMDPDEHPRPEAPTYPRPASIPGESPRGR